MDIKTILAVLQGRKDAPRVLGCAVQLALDHRAHLIALHTEALPIPYATPMGIPDTGFIEAGTELARERAEELRKVFDNACAREGMGGEWRSFESFGGDSAISALESARCADLVVVQQTDPDADTIVPDLEALLFQSGRPVLFVPYAIEAKPPFRRVVVAWNGSPEAARATFDALPFLKRAEEVVVITVDAETSATQDAVVSGAAIAAALARHGVRVRIENQAGGELSASDAIQNWMSDSGADLLVAGAYSQSRVKEFFFGGVTRSLLKSMTTATLLSR